MRMKVNGRITDEDVSVIRDTADALIELDLSDVKFLTSRQIAGIWGCRSAGKKIRLIGANPMIIETLKTLKLDGDLECCPAD